MKTNFEDIEDFHFKFAQPGPGYPQLLEFELFEFRRRFLQEELNEFVQAHRDGDLEGAADGLIDLAYVCLGTAHLMGLPWQPLWNEVHSANMRKVLATSADQSKRGYRLDVVKPKGWIPPDVQYILDIYGKPAGIKSIYQTLACKIFAFVWRSRLSEYDETPIRVLNWRTAITGRPDGSRHWVKFT